MSRDIAQVCIKLEKVPPTALSLVDLKESWVDWLVVSKDDWKEREMAVL